MALQDKLEQLNIPEREAQVYLALLAQGLTPVGPIITKTKLHRMMVYQSLEKLKDMKMASMVMKNGRQHWQASNPSIILDRVKKQERIAQELVHELEEYRNKTQDDLYVEILYGRNGLIDNLEASLKLASETDKTVRIIGGTTDEEFYELLGDWSGEYVKMQKSLGVKKKLIATENCSTGYVQRFKSEVEGNECVVWKSGLCRPALTRITQKSVSIEVYGREPIIIQIFNDTVAQAYVESFEIQWRGAKLNSSETNKY